MSNGAKPGMPKAAVGSKVLPLLLILILVAAGAGMYYLWSGKMAVVREIAELRADPQKIARQESKTLVETVGKLIVLPEGEDPTIATVSNVERLKDQPFFARAKVGDKVLIYTSARKAILYSPQANKILEVAPVNIGNQQKGAGVSPSAAPEESP